MTPNINIEFVETKPLISGNGKGIPAVMFQYPTGSVESEVYTQREFILKYPEYPDCKSNKQYQVILSAFDSGIKQIRCISTSSSISEGFPYINDSSVVIVPYDYVNEALAITTRDHMTTVVTDVCPDNFTKEEISEKLNSVQGPAVCVVGSSNGIPLTGVWVANLFLVNENINLIQVPSSLKYGKVTVKPDNSLSPTQIKALSESSVVVLPTYSMHMFLGINLTKPFSGIKCIGEYRVLNALIRSIHEAVSQHINPPLVIEIGTLQQALSDLVEYHISYNNLKRGSYINLAPVVNEKLQIVCNLVFTKLVLKVNLSIASKV